MMKIYMFLTLILYITFKNENIIPTNMCYDEGECIYTEITRNWCNYFQVKCQKSLNPHNFLNIYCNIVTDLQLQK